MSGYGISYLHYGTALIEAAVVTKVILVGQAVNLGKRFDNHPLLIGVFVKAVLYGLFVAAPASVMEQAAGIAASRTLPYN